MRPPKWEDPGSSAETGTDTNTQANTCTAEFSNSSRQIAAYEDAAAHLLAVALTPAPNVPAMRAMWKAGGRSRRVAQIIAERWELAS